MVLQKKYRKSPEVITSYDFIDLVSKTGYTTYYLASTNNKDDYVFVTDTNFKSDETQTIVIDATVATTSGALWSATHDLEFNVPQNIKGDVIFSVPVGFIKTAASMDINYWVSGALFHYDGTTETQLGTGTDSSVQVTSGVSQDSSVFSLLVNVADTQLFKYGDFLRVKLNGMYQATNGGYASVEVGYMHDPSDRDNFAREGSAYSIGAAGESTRFQIHVPFKIEI